ncbi:MAG: carotenoid 1,2-hydratase [Herpetosiphonaceae bacterium]|nr:MAG: carotenoid 1,2-hydratase [Herpetosiphonaceae bacterium]
MFRFILITLIALLTVAVAYAIGRPAGEQQVQATISAVESLGAGDPEGFARAFEPRPFSFPADHGPHPEFRSEWWYYTGNLETTDGRHFGYQLTIFRSALSAEPALRGSNWATNQVYMAHFALSDVATGRFSSFERISRGAQGLAGAQAEPFRVWIEDWSVEGAGPAALPMRIRADAGEVAIDLVLESDKPLVLQGDRGLSRKGPEPGNASYYYSLTRMPTTGSIRSDEDTLQVSGLSWMDREWSTSALGEDLLGWDWFALQLVDGREVMYYQLRRRDGQIDPFSSGVLVGANGTPRPLSHADVQLEVLAFWQSPHSHTRYPARWRLRIPAENLDLVITPYLADQELHVSVRYWEGAVGISNADSAAPAGSGYVELVGYDDQPSADQ